MIEKIVVPVLGESITEATVSKWLKKEGDNVEVDEPIVELETDKVNLEVPSPISGVLTEISSKDGSVVEVGALLGSVSENKKVNERGSLALIHGSVNLFSNATYVIKPEVGDFYLFPNYLLHSVYPFSDTNEERRSISFNANLDNNSSSYSV